MGIGSEKLWIKKVFEGKNKKLFFFTQKYPQVRVEKNLKYVYNKSFKKLYTYTQC